MVSVVAQLRVGLGHNIVDPFEDTESSPFSYLPSSPKAVTTSSIRSRILKAGISRRLVHSHAKVTTSSIRSRILKVLYFLSSIFTKGGVTTSSIRSRILKVLYAVSGVGVDGAVTTSSIRSRILKVYDVFCVRESPCVTTSSIRSRILKGRLVGYWTRCISSHNIVDPFEDTESSFLSRCRYS